MNKEECNNCIKIKTSYCPNSNECYSLDNLPHFRAKIDMLKENEALKKLCDKYDKEQNTTFKIWLNGIEETDNLRETIKNDDITINKLCSELKQAKEQLKKLKLYCEKTIIIDDTRTTLLFKNEIDNILSIINEEVK